MRKLFLLYLLVFVLIVVGCVQDDNAPVAVVVEETAVSTPTSTETAVLPTATHQPASTPTLIPTETFTPTITPLPTWSPPPTPTPIPAVAFETIQYTLTNYDLDAFLRLIQMCHNGSPPNDCRGGNFSNAYLPILAHDLERFYPEGIPGAMRFLEKDMFPRYYLAYTPTVLQNIIRQGVLAYLNMNNIALISDLDLGVPDLSLNPLSVNLDSDSDREWILEIRFFGYGLQDWLVLDVDENGRYVPIPNTISPEIFAFQTQANVEHDLTGDGLPEVLLIQDDYLMTGNFGGFIKVHTWDEDHLLFLGNIPFHNYRELGGLVYDIEDLNENHRPEVHINWQRNGNYECRWEQIDTYEWNGAEFEHAVEGDTPPETTVCNIARGVLGFKNLEWKENISLDERIQLIEDGLDQLNIKDAPSINYLSLARVRLAMQYALRNDNEKAMETLQTSLAYPAADNEFTQLVQNSLDLTSTSPLLVCNHLLDALLLEKSGIVISDIIDYVMIGGYPITPYVDPKKICPLNELIQLHLDTLSLPSTLELPEALESFELPYVTMYTANLDNDPEVEWIGYLDLAMPRVIYLDIIGERWAAQTIYNFGWHPYWVTDYDLKEGVVIDGDEFEDVLLQIQIETTAFDVSHRVHGHVLWFEKTDSGLTNVNTQYYADEIPVPEIITEEYFTTGVVGTSVSEPSIWEPLKTEFNLDGRFDKYVNDLSQRVIDQQRPLTTLADLETLLASLPDDDEAYPLRHQLLFLRGYHYELAGDGETAISHFLTLIQQAPNSPWSWLAWSRLKPVE